MTGAVAQYGRASGLMKEIAGAILNQFADNLRKEIERSEPAAATSAASAPASASGAAAATSPSPIPSSSPPTAAPRPAQPATPISAFSILWIALKSWIAGLLGARRG